MQRVISREARDENDRNIQRKSDGDGVGRAGRGRGLKAMRAQKARRLHLQRRPERIVDHVLRIGKHFGVVSKIRAD